ncbi:hypothetical protein [uncultured Nostoc sp.]|uniref:hypothetical protein n=1 Tax=uncultured Nostoc sp. TaxID=340711 RepID=UPI0035CABEAF
MTFTQGFKPALNKEGFARCTFIDYEIKGGVKEVKDKSTGEIQNREYELLFLYFEVKSVVRGTDKKINIATNLKYEDDNLLGITLISLGYNKPGSEIKPDDEGFEVIATTDDDEGFEETESIDLGIEEFLDSIKGNVYIAKVAKATEGKQKGFWQIDAKTIQLFKVGDKVANKPAENNSKGNGNAKNKAKPKVETVTTEETVDQLELLTN